MLNSVIMFRRVGENLKQSLKLYIYTHTLNSIHTQTSVWFKCSNKLGVNIPDEYELLNLKWLIFKVFLLCLPLLLSAWVIFFVTFLICRLGLSMCLHHNLKRIASMETPRAH